MAAWGAPTMADQLYLENIDEFVTDQNKIVRSEDWGTRARAWGPGPSEGGGGPGPLCVRSRGGGSGETGPPARCPEESGSSRERYCGPPASPRPAGGRAGHRAPPRGRGGRGTGG